MRGLPIQITMRRLTPISDGILSFTASKNTALYCRTTNEAEWWGGPGPLYLWVARALTNSENNYHRRRIELCDSHTADRFGHLVFDSGEKFQPLSINEKMIREICCEADSVKLTCPYLPLLHMGWGRMRQLRLPGTSFWRQAHCCKRDPQM